MQRFKEMRTFNLCINSEVKGERRKKRHLLYHQKWELNILGGLEKLMKKLCLANPCLTGTKILTHYDRWSQVIRNMLVSKWCLTHVKI